MKKGLLIFGFSIFLFFGLLLNVFTISSQETGSNNWKWPNILTLGTAATGTSNQLAMASWAPAMEKSTGMRIRLLSEGNYPLAGRWLKDNIISTYVFTPSNYLEELTANEGYATREGGPNPSARLLWLQSMSYSGFMTRADANIKSPYDLKGKRFAYPRGYYTVERLDEALINWSNLTRDDVNMVPFADYPSSIQGFLDGKADIVLCNPTSPQAYAAEGIPGGVYWLDLNSEKDPEGAARFWELVPERFFGPTVQGVNSAMGKWVILAPFFIYTSLDNIDEDLGYHFAKWLHENYDLYKDKYIQNVTMHIDLLMDNIKNSFIPVHEGTKKYLEELGRWNEEFELQNKAHLELLNIYQTAYHEAIKLADSKGINVDPNNKEWVELWNNYQDEKNIGDIWKKYIWKE